MTRREKLNAIVNPAVPNRKSRIYNVIVIIGIALSVIPLFWREHHVLWYTFQFTAEAIFIVDYIFQWMTADFRMKKGKNSFFLYPFTPWAIINLIAIIASLGVGPSTLVLFRILNLFRVLRLFNIIKKSPEYQLMANVFKKNIRILLALSAFAFFYIMIVAIIMFNAEPDTFGTFFEAFYWSAITMITVGYGDVIPVTTVGKAITIISSFIGVAIVALPSSLMAAAFMQEFTHRKEQAKKNRQDDKNHLNESN